MASDNERFVDYLDLPVSSWKRPEGPPRVWRVFDGRRKTASGEIPRFSIQEVPEELEEEVVDFIVEHFLTEEPISVDQGVADDPLAVREMRTLWKNLLCQGVSIVALTVNSDPAVKPVIAGLNVLNIVTAEDQANSENAIQFRSRSAKQVVEVQHKLSQECNVLKKYGVDRYLSAFGLSVHPFFRGQGLGEELLKARDDVGVAYQIPVSVTNFTGTASQTLAYRTGFEVLVERKYSELLDDEGKVAFPGVTVECMKVMGKRIY